MKRTSWYPLAGLLVLVLAGLAFWRTQRTPADAPLPAPAGAPDATAIRVRPPMPTPTPRDATPDAPRLPAGEPMPLPDEVAALLARAESGDAKAACQLGIRLSRCGWADSYSDRLLEHFREAAAQATGKDADAQRRDSEAALAVGLALRRECDPLPASLRGRAFALTRQAALAGEPDAIVAYLRGDPLSAPARSMFGYLRATEFDTWRNDVAPMLAALEDAGRPEAALLRLQAARGVLPLAMALPTDPVGDEANRQLTARLFGEHDELRDPSPRPTLTPAQRDAAARQAAQLHEERYGGRRLALDPYAGGLHDLLSDLRRTVGEGKPAPVACADGGEVRP